MMKRAVDIIVSILGLIVLAPVFGLLWALIRFNLGAPVVVSQQRPGRDGELFGLLQFRTTVEHDPILLTGGQRITRFGSWLQTSGLDELPSLVNVLKGQMSLVGPRPLNVNYLDLYTPHQARRHEVRPGITGLAKVSGRDAATWEARFDLDVHYVDHHNLWMDLKIMARTIARMFSRRGIDGELDSTMFVGEPPRDGLTEEPIDERWQDLWESWQRSSATMKIGDHDGTEPHTTRYWVYLDDREIPVGIAGLSGLGGPVLYASVVLGPNHHTSMAVEALLERLIYHGTTYDAHRIFLRLSESSRALYDTAQQLGFVPIHLPRLRPHVEEGEMLVAFAAQTGI
jgi:lipopolysaccharide/colanic/teichoic acid biosynthesis glycosyltransferase